MITKKLSALSICFLVLVFITSCKDKVKPVTKEEAKEFAKQIEISIRKGDATQLDNAIDTKTMVNRMNLPGDAKTKGLSSGLKDGMKLGTAIVNTLTGKGNY